MFNSFHAAGFFLYFLKTKEIIWFSVVFRVHIKRPVAWNRLNVMLCAVWCYLYIRKREKHPWRDVTFSKVTKSNTTPLTFSTFLKLYKWYQIVQSVSNGQLGTNFSIKHSFTTLHSLCGWQCPPTKLDLQLQSFPFIQVIVHYIDFFCIRTTLVFSFVLLAFLLLLLSRRTWMEFLGTWRAHLFVVREEIDEPVGSTNDLLQNFYVD